MNLEKRRKIFARFRDANPNPTTELAYTTPFELLVAVVLFLLAAFDVALGSLNLVTLGLAAFAGSFLISGWKR